MGTRLRIQRRGESNPTEKKTTSFTATRSPGDRNDNLLQAGHIERIYKITYEKICVQWTRQSDEDR